MMITATTKFRFIVRKKLSGRLGGVRNEVGVAEELPVTTSGFVGCNLWTVGNEVDSASSSDLGDGESTE